MAFNAGTAEQALIQEPVWIGYAQHSGGETANSNDTNPRKDGDHPIAYLRAGSHATYYGPDTMIGWGENGTASGCDVTTGPSRDVRPQVVLIPDQIDPGGPFAWALFEGRWGARDVAMFNGPKGPNLGKKWNDPTAAFESWRPSTLVVPSSKALGINATDLFCSLSESGSRAFVKFGTQPWRLLVAAAVLLGVIAVAVWRVRARVMEALDIYGDELRTFFGIGLFAIPIGVALTVLQPWITNHTPLRWITGFFDNNDSGTLTVMLLFASVRQAVMLLAIAPAIICATKTIRERYEPGVWESYRNGFRVFPKLLLSLAVVVLAMLALSWNILLLPVAIYILVRWQFFSQAIILNGRHGARAPLAHSWRITRGRWWRTSTLTFGFQLLGIVPAPLIGVVMLVMGGANLRFANIVSSALYATLIPLSVIGLTIAYRRLNGDQVIEPFMPARERDAAEAQETQLAIEDAIEQLQLAAEPPATPA